MVGKKLLKTVLLSGALVGGLFVVAGAAPAFADNQRHEQTYTQNYNQDRSHAYGFDRDQNSGHLDRDDRADNRYDRIARDGDRDRHDRDWDQDRDRDRDHDRR